MRVSQEFGALRLIQDIYNTKTIEKASTNTSSLHHFLEVLMYALPKAMGPDFNDHDIIFAVRKSFNEAPQVKRHSIMMSRL